MRPRSPSISRCLSASLSIPSLVHSPLSPFDRSRTHYAFIRRKECVRVCVSAFTMTSQSRNVSFLWDVTGCSFPVVVLVLFALLMYSAVFTLPNNMMTSCPFDPMWNMHACMREKDRVERRACPSGMFMKAEQRSESLLSATWWKRVEMTAVMSICTYHRDT